ncbi:MAG: hypothetical protein ABIG52_00765 [Nanoarchaeota archaeon]|nr:hypothetical protein [Nanoarchaeota archaeon]MBU1644164.1 hypothetical protein [Nanoarchaeota archaeon]
MLAFGFDVPLVEIIIVFTLIIFILLVETIIIISLLIKQLNKTKELGLLIQRLSDTLLEVKKAEIDVIERVKRRR